MIDFFKANRKLLFMACVLLGFAPFSPEPHLFGKIRWVIGGAIGMQPMDWLDLLWHSSPFFLLTLSYFPTEKSKKMEEIVKSGTGTIVDVRTPHEFMGGHVAGAKNIPLAEISRRIAEIKSFQQPIIVCCASGMRSAQANSTLNNAGLECYNGGPWTAVNAMSI